MRAFSPKATIRKFDLGLSAALGASLIWGTLPLYWHLLRDVSPFLILCHRIVWACLFLFPLVIATHRLKEVVKAGKDAKTLRGLFISSLILGANWALFIWAVNNGRILETSLGYYINPLITICMGIVFFRDRPTRTQGIAIGIAFTGVAAEVVITGIFPVVGLAIGLLFAVYALLRKLAPVESLPGLALETLILFPFALAFIFWTGSVAPGQAWGKDVPELLLLMGTGIITSVPLILYAYGARHLPFTTLGILQYISPTCSFLIGVFVFHEDFTFGRAVSFAAVWLALAVYTTGSLRARTMPATSAKKREAKATDAFREEDQKL